MEVKIIGFGAMEMFCYCPIKYRMKWSRKPQNELINEFGWFLNFQLKIINTPKIESIFNMNLNLWLIVSVCHLAYTIIMNSQSNT